MNDQNHKTLLLIPLGLLAIWVRELFLSVDFITQILLLALIILIGFLGSAYFYENYSIWGRERKKRLEFIRELPTSLLRKDQHSISLGFEPDLHANIFLPDNIRKRHIHILGATGSGKTESVILNFLRQDIERGLGSIVLDAKGDQSFIDALYSFVPKDKLFIFDLGSADSLKYNPLNSGTPLESAQRLFSSLTWSEEYYKSKALSCLQKVFERYFNKHKRNPTFVEIYKHLETADKFASFVLPEDTPPSIALKEFQDISGLRDQIRTLTTAYLAEILSPKDSPQINLESAQNGAVIYFRLQSLISSQIVGILGKLVINHLNFLAGTAHRERIEEKAKQRKLVPIYFDEFASFACPEFADLISKARSAGFALHFSHQSIGDVIEVSPGFLNRITDNAATKIVLRINDPDSAEFFARSFGTKLYQKTTQRITNAKEIELAEIVGEGTTREAHQFRASPDLLKTLPTGKGAVLIAHGYKTPHGASSVLNIDFPRLK